MMGPFPSGTLIQLSSVELQQQFNNQIMSCQLTLQQLAMRCGDFFKSLSQYCYEFPKKHANTLKTQKKPDHFNHSKNNSKKQSLLKQKLPLPAPLPKKPVTPYITYFQQHKNRFQQSYPDLNLSDITKLIAKEWKERSEMDKKPYLEKAESDRKRYEVELTQYEQKARPKKTVIEIEDDEEEEAEEDDDEEDDEEEEEDDEESQNSQQ